MYTESNHLRQYNKKRTYIDQCIVTKLRNCHLPRAPMVVAATGRGARLRLLTLMPLALRCQLLLLHCADHSDS